MSLSTESHLKQLRSALIALKATGPKGFEGLLSVILGVVCNQPFRLATSGTQRGRDGDSAFDAGATYFEAKRYSTDVPKSEVAAKLIDIKVDNRGQVDTWVIGATAPVPALRADDFRRLAENEGIGIVLLDWSDATVLPALAIAVAMAGDSAKKFLSANLTTPTQRSKLGGAIDAIDHLTNLSDFNSFSEKFRSHLRSPSIGLGLAKAANRTWFEEAFSNHLLARQYFNQPLAPNDPGSIGIVDRLELRGELASAFSGPPSATVFAVIGPEGAGKSWLVASAWLAVPQPSSLLLFATADELADPADIVNFEKFLIRKLIDQTERGDTEAKRKRWQRRLDAWRENPSPQNVRVTLCVDGLNQSPKFPWSRLIDTASMLLGRLGGRLVITTRSTHFPIIRGATATAITRVIVGEWSELELRQILIHHGIASDVLSAEVIGTLRNPRILGIALRLLDGSAIEKLEDLSVERLLFEHLRQCSFTGAATISGAEFAKTLRELAEQVVDRIRLDDHDDIKLFDVRLHDRLQKVASSRFFRPVGDDPDRYEIVDQGLLLGLGLWLVDALEKEERNKRSPNAQLEVILEPIAALDMTAEVVACAIEIACLREPCLVNIASGLIRHYASLQNISYERRHSLEVLIKTAPQAFIQAAKAIAADSRHAAGSDWLTAVIVGARDEPAVREVFSSELRQWLSSYSLAPERMMLANARSDTAETISSELSKANERLERKMQSLTEYERRYLNEKLVVTEHGNLDALHRLAFQLLAGCPLASFAPALFAWSFGNSINSSPWAPVDEFQQLIRFNRADWKVTRNALVALVESVPEERSTVSDWAIVGILRATGNAEDATAAEETVDLLTKDRAKFKSWRLVEKYCETDPCDPLSSRPSNIDHTVEQYRALDASKLHESRGNTSEDHFYSEAMPGIARFEPEAGMEVLRRLAEHALLREGVSRWLAIQAVLPASTILPASTVSALVRVAQSSPEAPTANEDASREEWATGQYSLFAALPHLDGNSQLLALAGMHGSSLLLNLLHTLKAADVALVESLLTQAVERGDNDGIVRTLAFVKYTGSILNERTTEVVGSLLSSPVSLVRTLALGIAAAAKSVELLTKAASGDWDAGRLSTESDSIEIWYGSAALFSAAQLSLLGVLEALDRMALAYYGFAASELGAEGAAAVADRIELALAKVLKLTAFSDLPDIERPTLREASSWPPSVNLSVAANQADPIGLFQASTETDEQFHERQRRLGELYRRFSKELTDADARLVLTDLTFLGMRAVVRARPEVVPRFCRALLAASDEQKRSLHLFAIQLASAIASEHEAEAVSLFRAFARIRPLIRHVTGHSKIPIEAEAIWSQAHVPGIAAECLQRLDRAGTDQEISVEVLAAILSEKVDILSAYANQLIASDEPAQVARAITLAGFSDDCDFASALLEKYANAKGFLGVAYSSAKCAYDRNKWARQWYARMAAADTPIEFWRCSVLLGKIVDARYDVWRNERKALGPLIEPFLLTVEAEFERRIGRWGAKRQEKLFGGKVPSLAFLS